MEFGSLTLCLPPRCRHRPRKFWLALAVVAVVVDVLKPGLCWFRLAGRVPLWAYETCLACPFDSSAHNSMAKTNISCLTSRPRASSSSSSKRPLRRRPASLIAAPSSGLLAFLASLVSSTTAGGLSLDPHTAPPDFLCPSVDLDLPSDRPYPPRRTHHAVDSEYTPPPRPTRAAKRGARRVFVPDKYAQGDDGRWRKTQSWTLYGSTVCEVCHSPSRIR